MKIALMGSAPASVDLAPFNDPSWQIWACSPGAAPHCKRVDAFFEMHRWEPGKPWLDWWYCNFLAGLRCPVYTIYEKIDGIPNSCLYPKKRMLERFRAPWFMTSTLSWMAALAIEKIMDSGEPGEIAFFGVDMSAQEEWFFQRSGCHFFIWYAQEIGNIKVTIPGESDLLRPPPLYGFCEIDPHHIKMLSRKNELIAKAGHHEQAYNKERDAWLFMKGALDVTEYDLKTWVSDRDQIDIVYGLGREAPPAPAYVPAPVPLPASMESAQNGAHARILTEDEMREARGTATVITPSKTNGHYDEETVRALEDAGIGMTVR